MKEIKEIFIPLGEAISALSAGQLLSHAESFYCPDFYRPAEIKEIAEIIVTRPREVLSALSAGLLVSHAESFLSRSHRLCRFARRRNKGNKGNLHPPRRSLSAISAISAGNKHLPRENRIVPQK